MILTKEKIIEFLKDGTMSFGPNPIYDQIGDSCYDVTLGVNLYECVDSWIDLKKEINFRHIIISENGTALLPNRFYLGVTNEFTATPFHKPEFNGRSSVGRVGLATHITAGWGDVGFAGHWTLEMFVLIPTKVYPNMPIGQIQFQMVTDIQDFDKYNCKEINYCNSFSENPFPIKSNLHLKIK